MHPSAELSRLAACKAQLRRRIAFRRTACAEAAVRAARPLAWFDQARRFWRQVAPFAGLALAPMATLFRRPTAGDGITGLFRRWGPALVEGLRIFRQLRSRAS